MAGTLSSVLDEIYGSSIGPTEQRYLAKFAVGIRLQDGLGGSKHRGPGNDRCHNLEEMLHAIGTRAGTTSKPDISRAKQWLRQQPGGTALASRLGKFSKFRNAAGHPDVGLLDDIMALPAAVASSETEGEGAEHLEGFRKQLAEAKKELEGAIAEKVALQHQLERLATTTTTAAATAAPAATAATSAAAAAEVDDAILAAAEKQVCKLWQQWVLAHPEVPSSELNPEQLQEMVQRFLAAAQEPG